MRRRRSRAIAPAIVIAGTLVAALFAAPASAVTLGATITVNSLGDTVADDGACTFREAIAAADTDAALFGTSGECAAGSGDDTIDFAIGGTIAIGNGLEVVNASLAIDGGGAVTLAFGSGDSFLQFAGLSTARITGLTLTGGTVGPTIQALGPLELVDSHISGKAWGGVGGAIYAVGPTATIVDSTITDNVAGLGGGIYTSAGTVTIVRTTIDSNSAINGGGGLFVGGLTTAVLDRSTVSNNTSSVAGGGGIAMNGVTGQALKVWNSTIAGNSAPASSGGGILRNGDLELVNATVVGNSADVGGGVETVGTDWTLALKNSVLLGNTATAGPSDWSNGIAGELAAAVNSQIGLNGKTVSDWFTSTTVQDNGGPTRTLRPKVVAGNALLDGGNAATCAGAPIGGTDQRGYGRTSPCDIGAVDVDQTKPVVSAVKASLRQDQRLSGTSMPVRITWSASDTGSGVDHYILEQKLAAGWTTVAGAIPTRSYDLLLPRSTDFAFRVRAVDREDNASSYAAAPVFTTRLVQQTSTSVVFSSGWKTVSNTKYSGGSTKTSTTSGKAARITATGRSYAWVSTFAPGRGTAKVYVDGVLRATINLDRASTTRALAWSKTYTTSRSRTIRIVVSGSGERVDVDAFAILK